MQAEVGALGARFLRLERQLGLQSGNVRLQGPEHRPQLRRLGLRRFRRLLRRLHLTAQRIRLLRPVAATEIPP